MSVNTLDITHEPERTKEELHDKIVAMVKDTQRVIIRELPNVLLMTPRQFQLLSKNPEMGQMQDSDQLFYFTKYNLMEVKVKQ